MDEFDKYFNQPDKEDEFSKYFPKPQAEAQDEFAQYFPPTPSPGSPEYSQKVQEGLGQIKQLGLEEQPADPHPIEDPVNLALMTATPLSLGGGFTKTAISGGLIGAGVTQAQSLLNEGKPASLGETAAGAAVGTILPTALKGVGEIASPVTSKIAGMFSSKIKDVAKFEGVGPQQINKVLQQSVTAAKQAGQESVSRGTVLDDMIKERMQTPEGAKFFEKYADEMQIGQGHYPGIPNLEGKVTQETAQKVLSDVPVAEPRFDQYGNRITGKTLNLDKLSPDDKVLQQQIDNMVNMFPDEAMMDKTLTVEGFKRLAAENPGSVADDFLRNKEDMRFPPNALRKLAVRSRMAEELLIGHSMEKTSQFAKQVAEGNMDALPAFKNALEIDLKLAQSTGAFRSELGRQMRMLKEPVDILSPQAKFTKDVSNLLNRLGTDKRLTDVLATKMASVDVMDPRARLDFFKSIIEPTNWDRITELWYNDVLSGMKTQARNTLGNIGAMGLREVEKPVMGAIDLARSTVTGKPREAFVRESLAGWTGQTGRQFLKNPEHGLYSMVGGIADGLKAGYKAFVSELPVTYPDISINELIENKKFIGGVIRGTKGRIIRLPSRTIMATDEFFKGMQNRIVVNSLAYRQARKMAAIQNLSADQFDDLFMSIKSQPDELLKSMAKDEVLYRTFQNDPGKIINSFLGFKRSDPRLNMLFPFVRTPSNLMIFTGERLPGLNLYYFLTRAPKEAVLEVEDRLAKMAVSTATAFGLWQMYKHGLVRGAGVDPKKKGMTKGLMTAGEQNYSFVGPDGQTSVSFLNFSPFSGIIGFMADGFRAADTHPILSYDFVGEMTRSLFNQTGMQSYMGTWDTIYNDIGQGNIDKAVANATAQWASGLIPGSSFLRSVGMGLDPTFRTPFENQSPTGKFLDYMKLNIPGLRSDVMPVMDVWGNDVVTGDGVAARLLESVGIDPGPGATMVDGIGNPFRIEEASKDPVNIELTRLIHTLGPEESFRGLDSPRLSGSALEGLNLTQDEYVTYVKTSGKLAHDAISEQIGKSWYQAAPDSVKIDFYEKMISRAREMTKNQMFGKRLFEQKRQKMLSGR